MAAKDMATMSGCAEITQLLAEGEDRGLNNNPNQQLSSEQQNQFFTNPQINNLQQQDGARDHHYSQPSGSGILSSPLPEDMPGRSSPLPEDIPALPTLPTVGGSTIGSGGTDTAAAVSMNGSNNNILGSAGSDTSNYQLTGITTPGNHDVICGMVAGTKQHSGNINFMKLIEQNKPTYQSLPQGSRQKRVIAISVVKEWRGQLPPGRFLSINKSTDRYDDIGDHCAVEKAGDMLKGRSNKVREKKKKARTAPTTVDNNLQGGKSLHHPQALASSAAAGPDTLAALPNNNVNNAEFKEGTLVSVEDHYKESEDSHITQSVKGGIARVTKVIASKDSFDDTITKYDIRFVNAPRSAQGVDELHLSLYKGESIDTASDWSILNGAGSKNNSKRVRNEKSQDEPNAKKIALTSSYNGIRHWPLVNGVKWRARICHERKSTDLGTYLLETDAALAYDEASKLLRDPTSQYLDLNFTSLEDYEKAKEVELAKRSLSSDVALSSETIKAKVVQLVNGKKPQKEPSAKKAKTSKSRKVKAKKDPNQPKGIRSAYIFACEEQRSIIKKANPTITPQENTKLVAEWWRGLSEQDKQPFEKKAAADKERWKREMAEYNKNKAGDEVQFELPLEAGAPGKTSQTPSSARIALPQPVSSTPAKLQPATSDSNSNGSLPTVLLDKQLQATTAADSNGTLSSVLEAATSVPSGSTSTVESEAARTSTTSGSIDDKLNKGTDWLSLKKLVQEAHIAQYVNDVKTVDQSKMRLVDSITKIHKEEFDAMNSAQEKEDLLTSELKNRQNQLSSIDKMNFSAESKAPMLAECNSHIKRLQLELKKISSDVIDSEQKKSELKEKCMKKFNEGVSRLDEYLKMRKEGWMKVAQHLGIIEEKDVPITHDTTLWKMMWDNYWK